MCLYNIKQTATTYTADVDGKTYTVDVSKFPKEQAVAMAIEEIRAKAYPPKVEAKPAPEPPAFDTKPKSHGK